jgi:hypothetical protein
MSELTYLLDSSILLALLGHNHSRHIQVTAWSAGKKRALSPITELGFLWVTTSPLPTMPGWRTGDDMPRSAAPDRFDLGCYPQEILTPEGPDIGPYPTLTSMDLGSALADLARRTRSTPSLNSAFTCAGSASSGTMKLRAKLP